MLDIILSIIILLVLGIFAMASCIISSRYNKYEDEKGVKNDD